MQTTGGLQDANAFSAVFCNASNAGGAGGGGLFAYYSNQAGNCFYQRASCDRAGFSAALDFLGDGTLSLLHTGIDPKATATAGPGGTGEVVWMVRTSTCSGTKNCDANVTVAAAAGAFDGVLLRSWATGAAVIDPIDQSCSVAYTRANLSSFLPAARSDRITNVKVEAFVAGRIAKEGLYCSSSLKTL